jgi:hypothetical protein
MEVRSIMHARDMNPIFKAILLTLNPTIKKIMETKIITTKEIARIVPCPELKGSAPDGVIV